MKSQNQWSSYRRLFHRLTTSISTRSLLERASILAYNIVTSHALYPWSRSMLRVFWRRYHTSPSISVLHTGGSLSAKNVNLRNGASSHMIKLMTRLCATRSTCSGAVYHRTPVCLQIRSSNESLGNYSHYWGLLLLPCPTEVTAEQKNSGGLNSSAFGLCLGEVLTHNHFRAHVVAARYRLMWHGSRPMDQYSRTQHQRSSLLGLIWDAGAALSLSLIL